MNMTAHIRVAVIGLGAAGLVALKNFKEEGFDVTGFEQNGYIGGLWKFSDDDKTSVLSTTVVNISKERVGSSGFRYNDSCLRLARAASQTSHFQNVRIRHAQLQS
jgi:dimethylaniline monooxygenase (N-oxide forming)